MSEGRVTRRRVLLGLAGAPALAGSPDVVRARSSGATLSVRVYPGPQPRHGTSIRAWSRVHVDATVHVARALSRLAGYARATADVGDVRWRVVPCRPLDLPVAWSSASSLLDAFHDRLDERDAIGDRSCHLLLWWEPTNYRLGYGVARGHVAGDGAALAIANVGATETWDSRSVTRNMAIHEALHTFLTGDVVEEIVESRCDHDLGSAERIAPDTIAVSPIGTGYAGRDRPGSETRWHGSGCYDHGAFFHHDGLDGVEHWRHTTRPSEGVLEGVARYVDRYLR